MGLSDTRILNQEPGAALRIYRELITPYEPVPPILALHFQDLARLYLELQAWERIRDARLEHRWQQVDLQRRRLFYEMERDMLSPAKEVFASGLQYLPDSPAKFKEQAEALEILTFKLRQNEYNLENVLHKLYGERLEAVSSQAQVIVVRCKAMDEKG